jgi:hypothetical protein
MSTPYGIQITEDCLLCKMRQSGYFCNLPPASLQERDKVKYASAHPQVRFYLWRGRRPVGST